MNNEEIAAPPNQALDKQIGRQAVLKVTFRNQALTLRVPCTVVRWRRAYGRLEFNVTPVGGEGAVWVNAGHLELKP